MNPQDINRRNRFITVVAIVLFLVCIGAALASCMPARVPAEHKRPILVQ